MVDVAREFKRQPPREELVDLAALVRDFRWRYPRERRDMVVEHCRSALSLESAIERAVASKDASGKHHNHQSKIKRECYAPMSQGMMFARHRIAMCEDFDELHDVVEVFAKPGWGPVGIYDIATRIGAYLSIEPTSVYLHAGVRIGTVALFGAEFCKGRQRIQRQELPPPLRRLTADECEDFLCTYRSILHRYHGEVASGSIA